ncbi:hypothetical protein ACS0TY_017395 [Phlomoides rotata]
MPISEIWQGRILFQFFHPLDLARVVEGAPWSFGNHHLVIHKLQNGEVPLAVPLDNIEFWYEDSNKGVAWRNYMQIHFEVKATDPLKRWKSIWMRSGSSTLVTFKYEKLHSFYFIYGRLNHTERFYNIPFESDGGEVVKDWGVFLKANDRRGFLTKGDRWIRKDVIDSSRFEDSSMGDGENTGKDHSHTNLFITNPTFGDNDLSAFDAKEEEVGVYQAWIGKDHGHTNLFITNHTFGDNDLTAFDAKKRRWESIKHGEVSKVSTSIVPFGVGVESVSEGEEIEI